MLVVRLNACYTDLMSRVLQLPVTRQEIALQKTYGHAKLEMIRGAGLCSTPDIMFVFMNPTARNIARSPQWSGLRAPWIGINKVWSMFVKLGLISEDFVPKT